MLVSLSVFLLLVADGGLLNLGATGGVQLLTDVGVATMMGTWLIESWSSVERLA